MMQNLDSRMNEEAEKSRPLSRGRRAAAVVSAGLAFALALSGALPATSVSLPRVNLFASSAGHGSA